MGLRPLLWPLGTLRGPPSGEGQIRSMPQKVCLTMTNMNDDDASGEKEEEGRTGRRMADIY